MMQCPIYSGCMSPKFVFLAVSVAGFGLGVLSAFWPGRSIGLYQWIMARFNWKVEPIDLSREVRNTRILGAGLILITILLCAVVFSKF